MKYRVLWSPQDEERLESILRTAEDAQRVVNATREFDRELLIDPNSLGESRHDMVRIGFVEPLAALFEVMDDVRTVIVYDVWRTDRK